MGDQNAWPHEHARNGDPSPDEEIKRQSRELEILYDVSVAISSTLEFEEILRVAFEQIAAALNVNTFFIALYNDETRELHFEFLVDDGVVSPKISQRLDQFGGLSGWIIAHRQPLLIADLQNPVDAPVSPGVIGSPTRSWLGVPLIVKDRLIGVMSVQSYEPGQFDAGHLRLLSAIGNQIGIVIENARLFGQIRAHAEELAAANEITRAINSTLNLDEVLQLFFERLTVLFNAEAGSLVLLDPLTNELVFEVVHGGAGASLLHKRMRSDQGIVGWVTLHGQSVLVQDVHRDSRWFGQFDQDTRFVTRSIIAAPIRVQDRTIGAVELINRCDGSTFTAADEKLLGSFAASAGIAIENARLHRQTERRLNEVSTLNLIANQLATSLNLEEILKSIAARLRVIFGCRACSIYLLDSKTQLLKLWAANGLLPKAQPEAIPAGSGIPGQVAAEGTPLYIERGKVSSQDAWLDPATQSLLAVPLLSRERVLGILSLDSAQPHAFSEEDQRLLTTVAAQVSTAVENAQLYEDLKERAQRLAQAYDELKDLDKLKTEFVQNISHELRTPLTFIKGYTELLRTNTFGDLPAAAREGLDIVAEKTDALIHLVNEILSLQRIGSDTLQLETVDLGALVQASVRAASFAAQRARINLRYQIARALPSMTGDAARLGQVFENLLDNAIKFSPDGGEIWVRVQERDGLLQVEIEDQGIGIAQDQLEKIFDRFYQVDGSTTRHFGGVGLGLTIVKRIVEAHQGKIWVESQVGKGSTFHVQFPERSSLSEGGQENERRA